MSTGAWWAFAVAAAVGAPARFVIDRLVQRSRRSTFPLGILVVNVVGCAGLGVVVGLARRHGIADDTLRTLGTGGVGAFTTFSTFGVQTVELVEEGEAAQAARYVVATMVFGACAAAVGLGAVALLA